MALIARMPRPGEVTVTFVMTPKSRRSGIGLGQAKWAAACAA